ncbi:transcription-repair coupling factor (superfamily II helicase) [Humidesulfovibrio mexicanus]|uniref:Transcription-repair-coupling factor n=1 Tax=Humidesulfovibrio mexicanus TaxID=147047 RepID=A0A238XY33_9BACT|nr:transcription-repair coupling factor (superfamily II helicase) [Humidesulfovibrio mexicanus]
MQFPSELDAFAKGRGGALRVFKSGPGTQALLAHSLRAAGQEVVLVASGAREFRELSALLALFAGPSDELLPSFDSPVIALSQHLPRKPMAEEWGPRWAALHALAYGRKPRIVLLTVDNLLPRWPSREAVEQCSLVLSRGEDMSPELVLDQAVAWGYVRRQVVTAPGEIAVRGDIVDVFAAGYPLPVRLEFFGDTLDEIRLFDPATQRSRADLKELTLLPVAPAVLDRQRMEQAVDLWRRLRVSGEMPVGEERELAERLERADTQIWPGLFYPEATSLDAFLPQDAVYVLASSQELRGRLEDQHAAWRSFLEREHVEGGWRWPLASLCWPEERARKTWLGKRQIAFEDLVMGQEKLGLDLPEKSYQSFADVFWRPDQARRPWTALTTALKDWSASGAQVALSFHTERSRRKFLSLAEQEGIPVGLSFQAGGKGICALLSPLKTGLEISCCGLTILPEDILQPAPAPKVRADRKQAFEGLSRHDDLAADDLIVHREYGLSRFGGLHHLKIGDVANDYLLLFFDGEDKLYLPVDRLNLVQRYKGPEGMDPRLDKLGGSLWAKSTERARKAIEKIAQDLVEMYAFRRVAKGYSYGSPGEMYREFEATFGFEETPDQAKAIDDVFADMGGTEPMDRLVCGDVGFGKTEVALRAAFRAVADGRQVALLCPTTVLAEQHFQTFSRRMEGFPVRIGMLSRFVAPKHQKVTIQAAARGEVDILIGTHRLLSGDVDLPRLGLLILDEEQRFGVKHKEKLKLLRKNIDVLTLTATPIPRTLQLSLSGIRGLSVIETPPEDRKPVETALVERDDGLLANVLSRELARGGQVFWVYNRVEGLEQVAEYVRKLAPGARVGMAHGQMSERALEDAMHGFWHKELDVLVCTAIVESGLDFPNANTLIVDQAQMFGLGQLYQLRGRVGRSDRQAYAFFVVPSLERLPEISKRRLRIILDLDYLGAGFQVAMEDLRLRGAGNILGEVQSGQIARVGLDLFLEMLEEEVRRVRGGPIRQETDPELTFVFAAHLPSDYVLDAKERLRYYKALSSARTPAVIDELAAELRDRFGPLPTAASQFLGVLHVKTVLSRLQVEKAELSPGRALLSWGAQPSAVAPETLVAWMEQGGRQARLLPPTRLELRYPEGLDVRAGLEYLRGELELLLEGGPEPLKTEPK